MNELTEKRTPEKIGAEIRMYVETGRRLALSCGIEIGRRLVEAKEMLEPMIRSSLTVLAPDADKDQTEAAKEAISEDMNMAMMNYMPLRGAFSFGAGGVSREQIEEILDALNRGSELKS